MAIIKRVRDLEKEVAELQRKRLYVPVLIVEEHPAGVYHYEGNVFHGQGELQQFAQAHGSGTIIIDDIPREGGVDSGKGQTEGEY